ncbi:MAG: TatD family hydrolase [Lentisphaerae bacterium]|nr:TatD family hydrolase [Lentisphaerota bacterium]
MFFDTHMHLSPDADCAGFFAQAREQGVSSFLLAGTSLQNAEFVCSLAAAEEGVYAAVGLHPHEAQQFEASHLEQYAAFLQRPKVLAVGEAGLDYHYNHSAPDAQRLAFSAFVQLAQDKQKALVVHCREAFDDCYAIVKEQWRSGLRFVLHSFTGTVPEAEKWLELDAYISFNGMLTFKKADNIRQALQAVPLEKLLLETDSPYLAPVPYRGKSNCSAYLPKIAEKMAELKGLPLSEIARITNENARRLFGIDCDSVSN